VPLGPCLEVLLVDRRLAAAVNVGAGQAPGPWPWRLRLQRPARGSGGKRGWPGPHSSGWTARQVSAAQISRTAASSRTRSRTGCPP
jgi:hypothetical protein